MEDFGEVPSEDLQRLVGAGGQVVHADIFILTACSDHVPAGERQAGGIVKHPDGDLTPSISDSNNVLQHFYRHGRKWSDFTVTSAVHPSCSV